MSAPECPNCGQKHLNKTPAIDAWLIKHGVKRTRGIIEVDLGTRCSGPAYFTVGHAKRLVEETQKAIDFARMP